MAKRHQLKLGDWESIFLRLEELVMANSGEDSFNEIFKILIAKLFTELQPNRGFSFTTSSSPSDTHKNINAILAVAADCWKGIFPEPARTCLTADHLRLEQGVVEERVTLLIDIGERAIEKGEELQAFHFDQELHGFFDLPLILRSEEESRHSFLIG